MPNSLYNALNGGGVPNPNAGGVAGMMQQFRQFQQMFRGNPRQQVQQLLSSGKMSQQQFNQLQQEANQLMQMLGGGRK